MYTKSASFCDGNVCNSQIWQWCFKGRHHNYTFSNFYQLRKCPLVTWALILYLLLKQILEDCSQDIKQFEKLLSTRFCFLMVLFTSIPLMLTQLFFLDLFPVSNFVIVKGFIWCVCVITVGSKPNTYPTNGEFHRCGNSNNHSFL